VSARFSDRFDVDSFDRLTVRLSCRQQAGNSHPPPASAARQRNADDHGVVVYELDLEKRQGRPLIDDPLYNHRLVRLSPLGDQLVLQRNALRRAGKLRLLAEAGTQPK